MKKLLIMIFILFSLKVYSIDIQPYWEIGEVKIGGLFQKNNPKAIFDFNLYAFKFYFYDKDTGLNFSLSPFYYDGGFYRTGGDDTVEFYIMSFINAELAFNTLYKFSDSDKYGLNLFASFHCVDPVKISRYQLKTGLEFAITSELKIFEGKPLAPKAKLLSIRTGFCYMEKRPMYFLDIGIDLGTVFWIIAPSIESSVKENKNSTNK